MNKTCAICGLMFPSMQELEIHLRNDHLDFWYWWYRPFKEV